MTPNKTAGSEMSAFERRRLENIAANKAILTDLSTTAKKILPAKKNASKASTPRRPRGESSKREPTRPTRMSSRLAGLGADTDSPQKRAMAIEIEQAKAENASKKARVHGDLNLDEIIVDGKKWTNSIHGLKGLLRGAQPGVRTFTDTEIQETTDKSLKDLQLRMSSLNLYEQWLPNGNTSIFVHGQ
ncbi:hypothetical protein CDD82_1113 [Ophiocordyceps australis]|uniref:Uncharacterized protein n=1 Tax=Ophiocordyceps australis TaxID=1399860 RepID=A0A2C5ZN89_9HYPO|nr:hypothetical protein CDD82_1113 [Ophiocordyceps australis]